MRASGLDDGWRGSGAALLTFPCHYPNPPVSRGIELLFQREPGVLCTAVGYTQGSLDRPQYKAVCSSSTGHCEAVQVIYDDSQTSYTNLCEALIAQLGGSMYKKNQVGNDRGAHYRSGIYPHSTAQRLEAEELLKKLQAEAPLFKTVQTEIVDAKVFWPAEGYHQQYLAKGGSLNRPQSTAKRCAEKIRCYG
jgi:peptide-methionine (S)-S-oxide reductase